MPLPRHAARLAAALPLAALSTLPMASPLRAQTTGAASALAEYAVGGEIESYARSLQALGVLPVHPWSLRGFSVAERDYLFATDSAHPWARRFPLRSRSDTTARPSFAAWLAPARVETRYNSTFPFGGNDGAVWAGRGLTASAQVGAGIRWGPLTIVAAPVVFWTQNDDFALYDNGRAGTERFGDALFPAVVDRPQRFGDAAYSRLDAGDSEVRLDLLGATLGFTNRHEWWGPSQRFPFLLGNNAAGFPHVFAGTSRPANLWLARAHARAIWGRLEQSDYFVPEGITRPARFATGLIVALQPRGLENLELGVARFIHAPWPDDGVPARYVSRAFEGIFKRTLPVVDPSIPTDARSRDGENQLAVVFGRLTVPGAGFEVYGEFGREDHPWDARYMLLNIDEQSSLTVGFRKSWRRPRDGMLVLRGESINFQQRSVDRGRGGNVFYIHRSGSNQGHTQRGQLLGADVGVGSSAGAMLGADLLDPTGRWTVEWRRIVRQELAPAVPEEAPGARALDVLHSLTVERLLFARHLDVSAGVAGAYNFDRDFVRDRGNVSVQLTLSRRP